MQIAKLSKRCVVLSFCKIYENMITISKAMSIAEMTREQHIHRTAVVIDKTPFFFNK
jgi:hypothetical protein